MGYWVRRINKSDYRRPQSRISSQMMGPIITPTR